MKRTRPLVAYLDMYPVAPVTHTFIGRHSFSQDVSGTSW